MRANAHLLILLALNAEVILLYFMMASFPKARYIWFRQTVSISLIIQ